MDDGTDRVFRKHPAHFFRDGDVPGDFGDEI
jgi:hypothetical protein